MIDPTLCPKCRAPLLPDSDLLLACGSTLAELSFGPDPTALDFQSEECRVAENNVNAAKPDPATAKESKRKQRVKQLQKLVAELPADRQDALATELGALDADLRQAIERSGMTYYAIGKLANVSPGMIGRFMGGERDLYLKTAARLARALGLELKGQ